MGIADHIVIENAGRQIWIATRHERYRETMVRDFEHYFGAVESEFRDGVDVVDYSAPKLHRMMMRRMDDGKSYVGAMRVMVPSFAEPYEVVANYGRILEPRHSDVAWDLGAYVGLCAVMLAPRVSRVVAVEPDTGNLACLLLNLRRWFHVGGNVTVIPAAVARTLGCVPFAGDCSCGSTFAELRGELSDLTVPALSLEDVATATATTPTLIKMDIEGAELDVLTGAKDFLLRHRPRMLIEPHRIHGTFNTDALLDVLHAYGYACDLRRQPGLSTPLIYAHD